MSATHTHHYAATIRWAGNRGTGTSGYRDYDRDWDWLAEGMEVVHGSADPAFRGDGARHNPEDMLVAALSSCHLLWYLHFCADAGIVVTAYEDNATGEMATQRGGAGEFVSVTLRPRVTIAPDDEGAGDTEKALALHEKAHEFCFIARSVNFPVGCEAEITVGA
jgi:organic hydroperoxide reductase OsmC/OhrA